MVTNIILASILGLTAASPVRRDDIFQLGPVKREYKQEGLYKMDSAAIRLAKVAWNEASALAAELGTTRIGIDYDALKRDWFGKDWNNPGDAAYNNYKDKLTQNIRRGVALYGDAWSQAETILFYSGGAKCTFNANAYTRTENVGSIEKIHHIHLCNGFFRKSSMYLALRNQQESGDLSSAATADNYVDSLGKTMYHETMHFSTVNPPGTLDHAYGVDCWGLAKGSDGTSLALTNADSYAMHAVMLFTQNYLNLTAAPIPRGQYKRDFSDDDLLSQADTLLDEEDIENDLTVPDVDDLRVRSLLPQDLVDGEVDGEVDPDHLDPNVWLKDDGLDCRGINGSNNWVTYDSLNPLIPTFCNDAVAQGGLDPNSGAISRTYNPGDNAVLIGMEFQASSGFKPNHDDCVKALTSVMNNCDGNDPQNPINHKRGGSQDIGLVRYSITPLTRRYTPGQCAVNIVETEFFSGDTTTYKITAKSYNGDKKFLATSGDQDAGDGHPLKVYSFYAPLEITPEKRDGDYIQFTIGQTSFTSKDNSASKPVSFCAQTQQGWSSDKSGKQRQMDCYFPC